MKKENEKFGIQMLVIGTFLGVIGGLMANVLEKQFSRFGMWYEVVLITLFFFLLWLVKKVLDDLEQTEK